MVVVALNRAKLRRQLRAVLRSRPEESLLPEGECGTDYLLKHTPKNWNPWAWITVKGRPRSLSVKVKRTDEGVVVDIFRKGEEDSDPVATTYAYFGE